MNNTRVIRRPAGKSSTENSSVSKWKWIAAVVALLLMAGGAYAFLPSKDPALARIEDLRTQMDGADDAQRRVLFGQMRQEFDNLTPEARDQMRDEWRAKGEARDQQRLNEYFDKSPKEQIAMLDEDIKRDEERRKEWEKRRAERGNDANAGNRGDGGGGRGDRGPGGGRDASGDPNARRKGYLDNSSPQSRAMRGEYQRDRDERRKQLGLPVSSGGGRGRR
jgi:hypothetical protein